MPQHGLHHYMLRPVDLEATKDFYVDLLELEVGHRPPLAFPGYWLYTGGQPTVHLIGPREADRGVEYQERVAPRDGQVQLFLKDPNGVSVELNYPDTAARAAA